MPTAGDRIDSCPKIGGDEELDEFVDALRERPTGARSRPAASPAVEFVVDLRRSRQTIEVGRR